MEATAGAVDYRQLEFLVGAASLRGIPADRGREVAFAGRSNAGKSSALNALAGRRALARTSKTPGRTQQINFFAFDDQRRLVDLPGYGFAQAPPGARRRWGQLVENYLRTRRCLAGVVLLVDVRRPLTELDRRMVLWCAEFGLPHHVVLTKADKLGRGAAARALASARAGLRALAASSSVQLFSAHDKQGLGVLRDRVEGWLADAPA